MGRKRRGNDHTWVEAHQIVRQIWQAVQIAMREPDFESDIATVDISELPHALSKAFQVRLEGLRGSGAQNTDDRYAALLSASHHRPKRNANERDELAPPHSITSSARASRVGGTTSPNVLAVCRLMTSSNLVARKTGRSAGLSPLRMRPL